MTKRLQVLFEEREYRGLQAIARASGKTVAEWVRQTLRQGMQEESIGSADKKLAVIRAATQHRFPAPEIDQMLDEIERGYAQAAEPMTGYGPGPDPKRG